MTVIFKVGGSLLTLPGLTQKLREAVDQRPNHRQIVMIGGGSAADAVREWSRVHRISDEAAHWLALASLDLTRELLAELVGWKSVSCRETAESLFEKCREPLLLETRKFTAVEEAAETSPLPHNWNVTSDSLAAWTAIRWPVEELILIKSVPTPHGMTASEASEAQLVDAHFPQLGKQLPRISWCNLRASTIAIEPWLFSEPPGNIRNDS